PSTSYIYDLSLHDALPIYDRQSIGTMTRADARRTIRSHCRLAYGLCATFNAGCGKDRPDLQIRHELGTHQLQGNSRSMNGDLRRSEEHTSELQSPDHLVCR